MKISVIITNYNYADYLGRAIESVLSQSVPADEIIVIDDGSTDHSHDVLARYEDRARIIYQDNSGQAAAMNAGFNASQGDILMLLDADDLFHSDKIKILKKSYQDYPEVSWIFHDLCVSKDVPVWSEYSDISMKMINEQTRMVQGTMGYDSPATSGLSFRKNFISHIFPLPVAGSIYISDHYIKFFCTAQAEGLHISNALGALMLHGNNLYTGGQRNKALATRGRIFINTAYYLRQKAPHIWRFCNNIFIEGCLCASKSGLKKEVSGVCNDYIKNMSLAEKLKFRLKYGLKKMLKLNRRPDR